MNKGELEPMEREVGAPLQTTVGALATPMDTDEDDATTTTPDGGGRTSCTMGKPYGGGGPVVARGGPVVAIGAVQEGGGGWTTAPVAPGDCTMDDGMMTTPDGGATREPKTLERGGGADGGGPITMDMDVESNNADYTIDTKGTILAHFSTIHSKGARPSTIQGRRHVNGGGSNPKAKVLTTTMKKTKKSRMKRGTTTLRGAKSTSGGKKLPRVPTPDSSQMEIGQFFFKLEGIIDEGSKKIYGGIPMGELQIPLKTRGKQ